MLMHLIFHKRSFLDHHVGFAQLRAETACQWSLSLGITESKSLKFQQPPDMSACTILVVCCNAPGSEIQELLLVILLQTFYFSLSIVGTAN